MKVVMDAMERELHGGSMGSSTHEQEQEDEGDYMTEEEERLMDIGKPTGRPLISYPSSGYTVQWEEDPLESLAPADLPLFRMRYLQKTCVQDQVHSAVSAGCYSVIACEAKALWTTNNLKANVFQVDKKKNVSATVSTASTANIDRIINYEIVNNYVLEEGVMVLQVIIKELNLYKCISPKFFEAITHELVNFMKEIAKYSRSFVETKVRNFAFRLLNHLFGVKKERRENQNRKV